MKQYITSADGSKIVTRLSGDGLNYLDKSYLMSARIIIVEDGDIYGALAKEYKQIYPYVDMSNQRHKEAVNKLVEMVHKNHCLENYDELEEEIIYIRRLAGYRDTQNQIIVNMTRMIRQIHIDEHDPQLDISIGYMRNLIREALELSARLNVLKREETK